MPDVAAREHNWGVWLFGAFSLAAVVNHIAIALCRRAQAPTERDLDE